MTMKILIGISRRHLFYAGALLVFTLSMSACDLVDSGPKESSLRAAGVLVANGGNFGDQNGFLTSYDPTSATVVHGPSLGGFLHGLKLHENRIYALLNTFSLGRIDVLDASTLDRVGQYADLPAPRAMAISGDVAYVTNLIFGQNGTVNTISLASGEISDPLEVGSIPEGIVIVGDRVYVANSGLLGAGTTLSIIGPDESTVSTIDIGCDGPRDLFVDNDGEIVILCSGKTLYNDDFTSILSRTNGQIVFFDSETATVRARIDLETQLGTTNGTIAGYYSADASELYAVSGEDHSIYRIDTDRNEIAATFVLPAENGLIGISGIAYDASQERLYVGRFPRSGAGPFPDFTSSGTVVILDRDGVETGSFEIGPAPSQIVLLPSER